MKLLLASFLLAAATLASADSLSVNLAQYCPPASPDCRVEAFQTVPGTPAQGSANFVLIGDPQWTFNFVTGNPTYWHCDMQCLDYYAQFGAGGTFLMTGADGLNFTGQVTSGTSIQNASAGTIDVNLMFSGRWSNGQSASGSINDNVTGENGPYVSLNTGTNSINRMSQGDPVPEPQSLLLLIGGGMAMAFRKMARSLP